jgi:LysR family transcriptional regulator, hypochlorite-specific transcription factor HypT
MMELDWLEDFMALTATQSFSRAAEMRHITQPAFSRRIRLLENWVGTALFLRLPRRILFTPAGEQFRTHAEGILRDLRHARTEALNAAGRTQTVLAIAATHALSFTFFPHWARTTAAVTQLGALNLLSDSMEACEDMMLRGEASFLLCHRHAKAEGRLTARHFRFLRVGEDVLVPLCAPDATGQPRWLLTAGGDPPPVPHLAYAAPSGIGRILAADWHHRRLVFNLVPAMTARLAATLLTMAEDGRGMAWLPLSLAEGSLARGTLVRAGDEPFDTPVDIVLYRPAARLGKAAERFWAGLHGEA